MSRFVVDKPFADAVGDMWRWYGGRRDRRNVTRNRAVQRATDDKIVTVRLTGRSGYRFTFEEVEWDATTEWWTTVTNGVSHTDLGTARESSGRIAVGLGIVDLWQSQRRDADGGVVWEFDAPTRWMWGVVTGYSALGGNRWTYAVTERVRSSTGWAAPTYTALSLTTVYNSVEAANNGSGVEGNSIDHSGSGYPSGFSMQPVQGSPVVRVSEDFLSDGTRVYSFAYINAEDGTCS